MEKRSPHRGKTVCRVLSLGALLAAAGIMPAAYADFPGGGNAKSDCYIVYDGLEITSGKNKSECTDGDPSCDTDGQCQGTCSFGITACLNDPNVAGCTPSNVTAVSVNGAPLNPPTLPSSENVCGDEAIVAVPVKQGKKGPKKGKLVVKVKATSVSKPKTDKDKFTLFCLPREGACPTTTTSTTTTSTLPAVCGDGTVGAGETCDPPCGTGGCGAGQICDGTCNCVAQAACACGTPDPMQALFRTTDGTGVCGEVVDINGMSLTVNAAPNDTPGLNCSGLYFGGRGNAVPLPNSVPNNGMSVANVCCSGTSLFAVGATAEETGSNRNCTSTGCLFGAPLPVINPVNPGTSTCVVNRLASPATGGGDCTLGSTTLQAPLSSEIFLAGDSLFNCLIGDTTPPGEQCGSDADCGPGGLCPTGIQPCPVCRGPLGSEVCFGGPNNGMACTPETTTPGEGYPTSHDCPPNPANTIGSLPISFTLSTGTIEKTAQTLGTPRVFCGFCRDVGTDEDPGTLCFEGNTRSSQCPQPVGVTRPCDSNDDCQEPYEKCEQNQPGAFAPGGGTAQTIRVFGTPAGDVTDRLEHAATLASVFCIPPTYDPIIDSAANLPGPGAVSLPGSSQLQ